MLFHDDLLPGAGTKRDRCVELLDSVEVASREIDRFDDLLRNREFTRIVDEFFQDGEYRIEDRSSSSSNLRHDEPSCNNDDQA